MSSDQKWRSPWELLPDPEDSEGSEKREESKMYNDLSTAIPGASSSQQPIDLTFVNISSPAEAADPARRKLVRQKARRKNHRQGGTSDRDLRQAESRPSDLTSLNMSDVSMVEHSRSNHGLCGLVPRTSPERRKLMASSRPVSQSIDDNENEHYEKRSEELSAILDCDYLVSRDDVADQRSPFVPSLIETSPINPWAGIEQEKINYPIEMYKQAYQLVEYIETDREYKKVKSAFKQVWFQNSLRDPAAFLQTFSTTITLRAWFCGADRSEALMYQQKALRSVQERLPHPTLGISDGIVGAVLTFLGYDFITQDVQRYKVHKAGLARIIQLRGGIETLDNNSEARLMILWDDVRGACAFGCLPNFPLPLNHLPPVPDVLIPTSRRFMDAKLKWGLLYPERRELMAIFYDLYIVNDLLQQGLPDIWRDPWILGLRINPILLRLLCPYKAEGDSSIMKTGSSVEDVLRLAALAYFTKIRVKFNIYHITGYHFIENIKTALRSDVAVWDGFLDLKLWVLVLTTVQSTSVDRPFFIEEIKSTMRALNIRTWEEVMVIVSDFLWMEEIYGVMGRNLGRKIMES